MAIGIAAANGECMLTTISDFDLSDVTGGAQPATFKDYTAQKRKEAEAALPGVACPAAGVLGGPKLAEGIYGSKTTDQKRINAAEMIRNYCLQNGLPVDAKLPF